MQKQYIEGFYFKKEFSGEEVPCILEKIYHYYGCREIGNSVGIRVYPEMDLRPMKDFEIKLTF